MSSFDTALTLILQQSWQSLLCVFCYTLSFEVPRYCCSFIAMAVTAIGLGKKDKTISSRFAAPKICVGVIGHNESEALERCVRSLREQSIKELEIIVISDGSSDAMAEVSHGLVKRGLVDVALATDIRGGKSAGLNLALERAMGDILVIVDCDCSYDRFAIEKIVSPFSDPSVGAVAGDLVPRNAEQSLIARFQAIEYLISISVGKLFGAEVGQIDCISGAFGAFRIGALRAAGGYDVGGGEDLDVTMRLRTRGWTIAFAPGALCYTDVPTRLWPLIRQRLRWERDSVRIRFRKHRRSLNALRPDFRPREALHQLDFLLFSVAGAVAFPVYLVWLFTAYGQFAVAIVIAMQLSLFVLDLLALLLADLATGRPVFWKNVAYLLGFSVFATYVMRHVRLLAYLEEWLLFGSVRDNYVPLKVRSIRKW